MGILWAVTTLALIGLYEPVLAKIVHAWRMDSYAGHGMFVPMFSAYFLWIGWAQIRAAIGKQDPAGILVVVLGLGILALGRWAESTLVQGLSVVVAVAGSVLLGFGRRCLREAAFPIGFLLFMVPLPRPAVAAFTLDLQRFAAGFAGRAVEALGIPVYQTGVQIVLPTLTLRVEEVCNGLRFLMALLVLTIAFAQVSQRTLARKLVLIAAAVPIAVVANAIRVATIALGVHYLGPQAAVGFIHGTIAKVIWLLTLIPLVGLGLLLRRGGGGKRAEDLASTRTDDMKHQVAKIDYGVLPWLRALKPRLWANGRW
ncbi:MAG TPA: exosortase/archaeosortase family protein [Candidatus Acidoferrum sp.]|nr:exosortase/archaeosortase family protein [Candidatus Acidoferrum sp.]